MATRRMLVDATHPEETRIVVTSGNRLEEFDFESVTRRQLRGNIYLAKVTRVEPSLQAAFVEYGGNRHGFLAFSEIHPDYYQIPVADREALLREEEAESHDEDDDKHAAADAPAADSVSEPAGDDLEGGAESDSNPSAPSEASAEDDPQSVASDDDEAGSGPDGSNIEEAPASQEPVESLGGGDALEDIQERRQRPPRRHQYKIQEVIKRRQVMLVQVVKEERGNKGAALTTYLSLAGRYSVLMPNTARGGGISRKITSAADRKRLKEIASELEVPAGMGIILRTAGASRTKPEVKRDFEYLMRLWENVRALTLRSQAPCLVYEEGSLIKRTIRDLYSKDIDELLVAGENAYREAKDFMRMIMPSHAKNVQLYTEDQPLFSKYNVEPQLDQMFSPQVNLPSGGYIVINPTEALVSIDVNSGRATREHNIEDTALQTNLEASEEISRQLRLRDLAGLIVIDFIDMMENRSNRAVERKLKDCLKNDRARIQVGRISHFGLMEMSRQRMRFGVVESSTHKCPLCDGTGVVRSVESVALMVMRHVEDTVLKRPGQSISVRVPVDVALYILNSKRETLTHLETKYQLSITIAADGKLVGNQFAIEKGEQRALQFQALAGEHVKVDSAIIDDADDDVVDEEVEDEAEDGAAAPAARAEGDEERNGRRRRRRRRGRGNDREDREPHVQQQPQLEAEGDDADGGEGEDTAEAAPQGENGEEPRRRRRRGRRGGRRNRRENGELENGSADAHSAAGDESGETVSSEESIAEGVPETAEAVAEPAAAPSEAPVAVTPEVEAPAEKPKRTRKPRAAATAEASAAPAREGEAEAEAAPKPKRTRTRKKAEPEAAAPDAAPAEAVAPAAVEAPAAEVPAEAAPAPAGDEPRRARKELPQEGVIVTSSPNTTEDAPKPKKAGWWQRRLGLG